MAKSKDIRIGVTDLYAAVATLNEEENTVSYAEPKVIGGTASIGVTQNKAENPVYESDVMIRNNSRISSATINYRSRTVNLADEMELLYGVTAASDGEYEDGPSDLPKNCAIGWAAKRSDGGYLCVWYYWCTGSKGDESYETATDSETTPEDNYDFTAMPSPATGKMRRRKIVANEVEKNAFFASVLKNPA